jgi:hypothetical protein
MKLEICRKIFEKYSDIKFNKYLFNGTQIVPCRQEGGQEGTD